MFMHTHNHSYKHTLELCIRAQWLAAWHFDTTMTLPAHLFPLPRLLLRTQGQLSNIFVIDTPFERQSLCHYAPITSGNLGLSLGTSDQSGGGVTQDYKAHCCPPSNSLHTHPTKPPPSQPAFMTLKNVVPVSKILGSIPACFAPS